MIYKHNHVTAVKGVLTNRIPLRYLSKEKQTDKKTEFAKKKNPKMRVAYDNLQK